VICRLTALLVLTFPFGNVIFAASTRSVQLRWEDLERVIGGKNVSVESNTGAVHKGRVRIVANDSILLEGRNPSVKRDDAKEMRFMEYVGNGRRIGRRLGGALGLTIGLVSPAAIGLSEGSANSTGDKIAVGVLAVGGLPLGLLAGDYLGKQADKQVAVIHIVPPAPAPPKD